MPRHLSHLLHPEGWTRTHHPPPSPAIRSTKLPLPPKLSEISPLLGSFISPSHTWLLSCPAPDSLPYQAAAPFSVQSEPQARHHPSIQDAEISSWEDQASKKGAVPFHLPLTLPTSSVPRFRHPLNCLLLLGSNSQRQWAGAATSIFASLPLHSSCDRSSLTW